MEISFPKGNVELPMSDQLQNRFFNRMGKVVYTIFVMNDDSLEQYASGFCISENGLILTAAHVLKLEGVHDSHITFYCRRHEEDIKFRCEVYALSDEIDVGLLRIVDGRDKKPLFDYVKVMDVEGVDNIPVAREVFMIGLVRNQCIHMVSGTMACGHNVSEGSGGSDVNLVTSKAKEEYDVEESTYYEDRPYRTPKGSFFAYYLEPQVPYLQINTIYEGEGLSGAPIFDSNGKVLGLVTGGWDGKCSGRPTTVISQWLRDNMRVRN